MKNFSMAFELITDVLHEKQGLNAFLSNYK